MNKIKNKPRNSSFKQMLVIRIDYIMVREFIYLPKQVVFINDTTS